MHAETTCPASVRIFAENDSYPDLDTYLVALAVDVDRVELIEGER